jgi:nicotinamide-nucleotide amidase
LSPEIEILTIGDELLSGQTINENSAFISKALTHAGYLVKKHITTGDNPRTLKKELKSCLKRADLTITTGGLGPTLDDLTLQTALSLFKGATLVENKEVLKELISRYGAMHKAVFAQAEVPSNANAIFINQLGSAPAIVFEENHHYLILLPGVPREMQELLVRQVIPFIEKKFPLSKKMCKKTLHLFNTNEIDVDIHLRNFKEKYPSLDFGIYPHSGTLSLDIKYEALSEKQALEVFNALLNFFPKNHFDAPTLQEAVHFELIKNNYTLSCAESCTGGALSAKLTELAGASKYLLASFIPYANAMKVKLLNVPQDTLDTVGAVSEETVRAMAEGARAQTGADFALSISGIAGPTGGTEEKKVGTVWMALASQEGTKTKLLQARGNRKMVIDRALNAALALLLEHIKRR